MQAAGVTSLLLCVISMFLLFGSQVRGASLLIRISRRLWVLSRSRRGRHNAPSIRVDAFRQQIGFFARVIIPIIFTRLFTFDR